MKSSYKRLGDYIHEVNSRNRDLHDIPLLGVSITKKFIPSIANIVGTDMSTYKLIAKNQFAYGPVTSRNGDKISIALSDEHDNAMVSQAYTVFDVNNSNEVLPEFLMMWFRRTEFDRYARFMSHGSAREIFSWAELCDTLLPIPSIEKQLEIVKEYNVIQNRIALNTQLIAKLEETAQTIYKQWFVDFEFPDDNGKPYKSSGGEMEWCEELEKDVPLEWKVKVLDDFFKNTIGGDWGKDILDGNYNSEVSCIRGADIPGFKSGIINNAPTRFILEKNLQSRKIYKDQIIIEISGGSPTQSTGRTVLVTDYHLMNKKQSLICSNFCRVLILNKSELSKYVSSHFDYLYSIDYLFAFENSTTGVKNFDLTSFLKEEYLIKPNYNLITVYNKYYDSLIQEMILKQSENQKLIELNELLLARMTKAESEKTVA